MAKSKLKKINKRAIILMILFFLAFSGLVFRVGHIQATKTVDGKELREMAEQRWTQKQILEGRRGTIYDRFGETLAEEIPSYTLYAILDKNTKNRVDNPRQAAEKLAPIVGREINDLEAILSQEDRFQVELGSGTKNLSYEKKREIEALELSGIHLRKEPRRYYPKQNFASHVIGYTERDMSVARMGLESSLNDILSEENGTVQYLSDRKGIKLPNIDEIIDPPKNGYDVYLTIDTNIQMALEQIMTQVAEQYDPERMIAIVADPKTGEILAMSNRPSFNPNAYEEITNYTNFAISSRFEPGSTMKIFTLAAAIEEGVYNGEELYQSGSYQIGGRKIRDHNQGLGWGKMSFDEGFQRSSNVAYSILALEKLGPERLYEYVDKFGFRQPTGIDLPSEANGLIADKYKIDAATTAFGQATAITPIQQIQAATAIANNGVMMKPYMIKKIVNPDNGDVIEERNPEVAGEPISSNTAKQVLDLMETVVTSPAGTGKAYFIEGFEIAGKTGTAEIANPNGPGYLSGFGQYIYSFMGVAPKSDPQVVVYVAVDRPRLSPYEQGSAPVSQIFTTIMKHSLQYLNIAPKSKTQNTIFSDEGIQLDNVLNKDIGSTAAALLDQGFDVYSIGTGKIKAQLPKAGTKLIQGEKIMLLGDNAKSYQIPDMRGWSIRDAMKVADILKLNANFIGSGYVIKQSISAGEKVNLGDYVAVELRLPQLNSNEPGEEIEQEDEPLHMD